MTVLLYAISNHVADLIILNYHIVTNGHVWNALQNVRDGVRGRIFVWHILRCVRNLKALTSVICLFERITTTSGIVERKSLAASRVLALVRVLGDGPVCLLPVQWAFFTARRFWREH